MKDNKGDLWGKVDRYTIGAMAGIPVARRLYTGSEHCKLVVNAVERAVDATKSRHGCRRKEVDVRYIQYMVQQCGGRYSDEADKLQSWYTILKA